MKLALIKLSVSQTSTKTVDETEPWRCAEENHLTASSTERHPSARNHGGGGPLYTAERGCRGLFRHVVLHLLAELLSCLLYSFRMSFNWQLLQFAACQENYPRE